MSSLRAKIQFRVAEMFRMTARRIAPRGSGAAPIYYNIGADRLSSNAPHALIIYTPQVIRQFLAGTLDSSPNLSKHPIYWESIEMVRLLNKAGYIVDYADNRSDISLEWSHYQIVIDEQDNLGKAPPIAGQTKVYYSTGNHWFFHNMAEMNRTQWFHDRHGAWIPPGRQIKAIVSDEHADIMTYYGTDFQISLHDARPLKHQLNISTVFTPIYQKKDFEKARGNFLWISGGGMLLKGADIVIEAFAAMPEVHLYIAGNCQEGRFWDWCQPMFAKHPNIHYLGWTDVTSQEFQDIANNCIGIVYPSSTEGGPSAVAQALHYGLIPVVTRSSNVRAEHLGYIVEGSTAHGLIEDLQKAVRTIMGLPISDLEQKSDAVRSFALATHTRRAYSESFQALIERIVG